MAISKIASAGVATDTLTAADLAPDSVGASEIAASAVGISELNATTGITSDYHKVPTFANDSARDAAIGSPTVGMLVYNTDAAAVQQYNGVWSTIAPAPNITSISGFLNNDNDSTLTVLGTNFNSTSTVKMFNASAGGTQIGSNATTTFNSNSKLTAVFGSGSIGASGSTAYIEVDNSGATNRFATAITVNADPTVVHAGATGTSANTTTHLGTYGGLIAGGSTDSNTAILLNFDRGGGTDIEDSSNIGGDGTKITASGGANIISSPFGDGKTAMFFDGSDDKLVIPDSADWELGTSSCVEFWYRCDSHSGTELVISHGGISTADVDGWAIHRGSALLTVRVRTSSTNYDLTNTTSLTINQWFHVAWTRDGVTARLFINGKLEASSTASTHYAQTANAAKDLKIGCGHNDALFWGGYLDEIRIVNGSAVYTSNFTVPTTRLTEITNTKLLIHSERTDEGNTTFTDSATTGTTHSITVTGSIHSKLHGGIAPALAWPASGKTFGSAGILFNGSGHYLEIVSAPVIAASSAFTFECWFNFPNNASGHFWDWRNSDSSNGGWIQLGSNNMNFKNISNGTDTTNAYTADQWNHIAYTRDASGNWYLYINGIYLGGGTGDTNQLPSRSLRFGRRHNSATVDNLTAGCKIDLMRFSTSQRYTGTSTGSWGNVDQPTSIFGAVLSKTIPTITFTGSATQLAADEDIEFTAVENSGKADGSRSLIDTDIGLTLTNLTGADKSKATLTGTITSAGGTTHTNMPLKLQVRKTLGDVTFSNASTTVTFGGSTKTTGLAPAMPVSGTSIAAGTTISTVDTTTQITLSANTTGAVSGGSLIFLDPTRVSHQYNGSDTIDNADAMYTLATATGGAPTLFNARRYAGNATARSITGFGFQPDLIWQKTRSAAQNHFLYDSIRGATYYVKSNATSAQATGDGVGAFTNDGFNLGSGNDSNENNQTFIAWGWKAGGANATNGTKMIDGTSSAMVAGTDYGHTGGSVHFSAIRQSASATTGLSITKFTLGAITGYNWFKHNLHATEDPDWVIIRATNRTYNWDTWHSGITTTWASNMTVRLNDSSTLVSGRGPIFRDSASDGFPKADGKIHINRAHIYSTDATDEFICYAFKAVAGVSAFGTYNGGAGAISCGFRPRWVMIKKTNASATASWNITDVFRGFTAASGSGNYLTADAQSAEDANANYGVELTSTGFTPGTSDTIGGSGHTYIYCAFA